MGCLLTLLAIAAGWVLFANVDLKAFAGKLNGQSAISARSDRIINNPGGREQPGGEKQGATATPVSTGLITPAGEASQSATPALPGTPPAQSLAAATGQANNLLPEAFRPSLSKPVSDLLFLSGGRLMRWERRPHQSTQLIDNIQDFILSGDGRSALLFRPHNVTVNGAEIVDLDLLDLDTGGSTTLLDETARPQMLSLAPAAERLAYVLQKDRDYIYIANTGDANSARPAAVCEGTPGGGCASIAWSPDGKTLAWSDGRGVWLLESHTSLPGSFEPGEPRLLHDNRVEVTDPEGQKSAYAAIFRSIRWSTDSRFILLSVSPTASKATWQAVLDLRTATLASIPDTFTTEGDAVNTGWFADNQVLVAHSSDLLNHTPPNLHFWHVFATNPELLVSGKQYDLYSDDFPVSRANTKSLPRHQLDWIATVQPGKIYLGVKLPDTDTQPVIFSLDLLTGKLLKVQSLPVDTVLVTWSPDGSGAVVAGAGGGFFFMPLAGGQLFDLAAIIQMDGSHLQWLAPALPRKTPR